MQTMECSSLTIDLVDMKRKLADLTGARRPTTKTGWLVAVVGLGLWGWPVGLVCCSHVE